MKRGGRPRKPFARRVRKKREVNGLRTIPQDLIDVSVAIAGPAETWALMVLAGAINEHPTKKPYLVER